MKVALLLLLLLVSVIQASASPNVEQIYGLTNPPVPGMCENTLLANCNFEDGHTGWYEYNGNNYWVINYLPEYAYEGDWVARFGGENNQIDVLWQNLGSDFNNSEPLYIKFHWAVMSVEETLEKYDMLYVQIEDSDNRVVAPLIELSNLDKGAYNDWHMASFAVYGLSAYADNSLHLSFIGTNDASNETTFFIDVVPVTLKAYRIYMPLVVN